MGKHQTLTSAARKSLSPLHLRQQAVHMEDVTVNKQATLSAPALDLSTTKSQPAASFEAYHTTAADLKAMLSDVDMHGESVQSQTPVQFTRSQSPKTSTSRNKSSPSRLVHSLRLIGSVARPVSVAAAQVFTSWCGAALSGVRGALQLRNEWQAAFQAKKQMREMRAKYLAEKQAAKERERMAMQRLQQLEQQIVNMQQQLMQQQATPTVSYSPLQKQHPIQACPAHISGFSFSSSPSPSPAGSFSTSSSFHVPSAPPMTPAVASFTVPTAPPMSFAAPAAPPLTVSSFAPIPAGAVKPMLTSHAWKPNATSLLIAAGHLRSVAPPATSAQAPAAAQTSASSTATGGPIDLHMLRGVVLRAPQPRAARPSVGPSSTANFLLDALQMRFHRQPIRTGPVGTTMAGSKEFASFVSSQQRRSSGGFNGEQTPAPNARHLTASSSAFSPMTPFSEAGWTPSH